MAINQTVMRSISTSVISALPIIALFVVAVWLMGIGTLRDLALIQLIGVVEGIFSSIFFATPLVVTFANMSKRIKRHNKRVTDYRAGKDENVAAESGAASSARTVVSPASATATPAEIDDDPAESTGQPGATWRPGR